MVNDGSSRPRRAHKPSSTLWSAGDDHPFNRKRRASEAAARLSRGAIAELFGLSLAEAAERVGVRHSPRAGATGWLEPREMGPKRGRAGAQSPHTPRIACGPHAHARVSER